MPIPPAYVLINNGWFVNRCWGLSEYCHPEQGCGDCATDRSSYRNPSISPVRIFVALVRSKQLVSKTRSSISRCVHSITCETAEGSTAGNDDAVYENPGNSGSTCITRNGSEGEYENECSYELREEVQTRVADRRSSGEAAADCSVVISSLDVICIENHQDRCAAEPSI